VLSLSSGHQRFCASCAAKVAEESCGSGIELLMSVLWCMRCQQTQNLRICDICLSAKCSILSVYP